MKFFHYGSRETALEHTLPPGRLWFGHLPDSNDPREFAPIWPAIVERGGERITRPFELIEMVDHLLRDAVHVLCLTEDRASQEHVGARDRRCWECARLRRKSTRGDLERYLNNHHIAIYGLDAEGSYGVRLRDRSPPSSVLLTLPKGSDEGGAAAPVGVSRQRTAETRCGSRSTDEAFSQNGRSFRSERGV
jgi:hypothetical protein